MEFGSGCVFSLMLFHLRWCFPKFSLEARSVICSAVLEGSMVASVEPQVQHTQLLAHLPR